jgi:hypothetical protein
MRRWQKTLFGIVVLVLLSQLPFAYRRRKLMRLQTAIQELKSQSFAAADPLFQEYKGVSHVHSFLGGHSSGNFQDIVDAARTNELDFVLMTEHTEKDINTAAMTLRGNYGNTLFVNGNEVSVNNVGRLLLFPGLESQSDASSSIETLSQQAKAKQGLAIVAYPQEFAGWNTNAYDGVEVYNVYSNAREMNRGAMLFDGLWSYRAYPTLLFANFYSRPSGNLRLWDEAQSRGQRLTALAGNDAHANVGVALRDAGGKTLLGLQLDPYARSFALVRMHLLLPRNQQLTSESLLGALREGHCFIGFDLFSDTTGFRFTGTSGGETRIQGDELSLLGDARFTVTAPLPSRIVLLKNGTAVQEQTGKNIAEFVIKEAGNYRCEVYLPQLPHSVRAEPWIISNPIYVR